MSDIFICYSRTDSVIAKQLTERLEAEGWSVYLDVQTRIGSRWHKVIQAKLEEAKAVVALWSAKSRDSDFVLEEADYGRRHNILFPAFIEDVEFPYGFSRIQTGDMIGWKGEPNHPGLLQLLEALREHLGVPFDSAQGTGRSVSGVEPSADEAGLHLSSDSVGKPTILQTPPTTLFTPGQTFRDKLKDGGEGPLMVVIPPGRFLMGSPPDEPERRNSESPQHEVIIQKPLALGVCAVTFADYDLFCQNTHRKLPKDESWGRDNLPVIYVSWQDAQAYCTWLSEQTGFRYRLPSEAEWEYACRAGTQTPFSFGSNITPEQVNYDGNYPYPGGKQGQYREKTVPVQSLPANAWGLYEMHGNVFEWVQDAWHENYQGAPTDGSAWESAGAGRVLRGGDWCNVAWDCRSASRDYDSADDQGDGIGFRCARVLVVS